MIGALITITVYNCYHTWMFTIWFREEQILKRSLAPWFMWFEQHSVDIKHWRSQVESVMNDRLQPERLKDHPTGSGSANLSRDLQGAGASAASGSGSLSRESTLELGRPHSSASGPPRESLA